jgi:hypothetical protein
VSLPRHVQSLSLGQFNGPVLRGKDISGFLKRFGYTEVEAQIRAEFLAHLDSQILLKSFRSHSDTPENWAKELCIFLTGREPEDVALSEFKLKSRQLLTGDRSLGLVE